MWRLTQKLLPAAKDIRVRRTFEGDTEFQS